AGNLRQDLEFRRGSVRSLHSKPKTQRPRLQIRGVFEYHLQEIRKELDRGLVALADSRPMPTSDAQNTPSARRPTVNNDVINRCVALLLQAHRCRRELIAQALYRRPDEKAGESRSCELLLEMNAPTSGGIRTAPHNWLRWQIILRAIPHRLWSDT